MIHNKFRYLLTLVALFAMTTGAWAQDHEYVDLGLPSGTLWATCNVGADSPEQYGGYFAFGEVETKSSYSPNNYKWASNPHEASTFTKYNHVDNLTVLQPEDDAATVNWGVQWRMPTVAEVVELIANCDITSTTRNNMTGYLYTSKINGETIFFPHAGYYDDNDLKFYGAGERAYLWTASVYENLGGMMFYNWYSVDSYCTKPASAGCGMTVRPVFNKDAVPVTTNAAEAGAAFTEATFAMPAFDATANYELVRDMTQSMTTKVGDGADGAEYRIRMKKNGTKWEPADMNVDQVIALFKVHDGIENKDLTFYGAEAVCTLSIYAADDNDQPTGKAITTFADLEPGRYVAVATAADGSAYDGSTEPSNVLVLYEGYPVTVPAKEYVTYYRTDDNLKLDEQNTVAKLYTITEVNNDKATAIEITSANKEMPFLIYNGSDKDSTFILIPTDDVTNQSFYSGFTGTAVATTIAASTDALTNYAFNGKQFVWVMNALAVAANKAWLAIPTSNARAIKLVFDEATTVEGLKNSRIEGFNGDWYTLDGRKLDAAPTRKGVYIVNGRKVVVK